MGTPFVRLDHELLFSPAWAALSHPARTLYLGILRTTYRPRPRYPTNTPTRYQIGPADVADILPSSSTYHVALAGLEAAGFIRVLSQAAWGGTKTTLSLSDDWRHYSADNYDNPPF